MSKVGYLLITNEYIQILNVGILPDEYIVDRLHLNEQG